MAFQIRRGTNQERLGITLVEGEIVYITDSQLVTIEVTSIDISTDVLTTTLNHGLAVNDQILFTSDTANGLTEGQVYFVKTIPSQTDFTLSTSLGGATLNITGVTGAVSLIFAVAPTDSLGVPFGYSISPLWVGDDVTVGGIAAGAAILADLADVEIGVYGNVGQHGEALENNDVLQYNDATNQWENRTNMTLNGDIAVNGGDVTTTSTTGNLFNANATTINIGNGATTEVNLGAPASGRVQVKSPLLETLGDIQVNGGDVTTTSVIGNLFNTNATTINIGNAATTEVNLGAPASGRVQIKSPLLETLGDLRINGNDILSSTGGTAITLADTSVTVAGDLAVNGGDVTTTSTTGNLFNTNATTVNIGNGATVEVNLGLIGSGRVQVKNDLTVTGGDIDRDAAGQGNLFNVNTNDINIGNSSLTTRIGAAGVSNTVLIKPGILVGEGTTQAVFNTVATTVNAFGAATAVNIGDAAGTVTIAGDLAVNGGDITTTSATGNLFNATATTVNAFGASTATAIGSAASGMTTIGFNATVNGDLAVNGGDLTTTSTTGNLFNTNATTVNIGNAATTEVNLGAPSLGRVQIKSPELDVNGNATITGNLTVNGTTTSIDTVNLVVEDNIITINKNQTGTPASSLRSGFEVERGDSVNVQWQWNENNKWFEPEGGADATERNIWASGNIIAGSVLATNGNDIFFNNADAGSGATSTVTVKRGSNADVAFRWNESTDRWQTTTDGTNYLNIPNQNLDTTSDVSLSSITLDSRSTIDTATTTTTSTAAFTLDSAARNAIKTMVYISRGTDSHALEILIMRTSTDAMITTYGEMYTTSPLATFTADQSGGSIRIRATPTSATSTTFSFVRTSLT